MESMLPDNPATQLFKFDTTNLPKSALLPLTAIGVDRFQVDKVDPAAAVFQATLGARSTTGGSHQFARYHLPPLAAPCPLSARMFVVRGQSGRAKQSHIVVVEYRASPKLHAPLTGLVVDVSVPPRLGLPGRVTPRGEWTALTRVMRFSKTTIQPGERGSCRIALTSAVEGAEQQQLKDVHEGLHAVLTFSGAEQGTLSGVSLLAGQDASALEKTYSVFHGQLEVSPRSGGGGGIEDKGLVA